VYQSSHEEKYRGGTQSLLHQSKAEKASTHFSALGYLPP